MKLLDKKLKIPVIKHDLTTGIRNKIVQLVKTIINSLITNKHYLLDIILANILWNNEIVKMFIFILKFYTQYLKAHHT